VALVALCLALCGCGIVPYRTQGTPLPYYTLKP